jgi:hypothetical protein
MAARISNEKFWTQIEDYFVTKKYFSFAARIWLKVTQFKLKLLASRYVIYSVFTELFVDPLMWIKIVRGSATQAGL